MRRSCPTPSARTLGYLTACPTNVGTGIRVGVMLHLPALVQTKQIDKVFRALQKINLAVRGLYGEGTQAFGDFYQISNQQTLGKSEPELIRNLTEVVPQIIEYERKARQGLVGEKSSAPPRPGQPGLRRPQDRAYDLQRGDDAPALQRPDGDQPRPDRRPRAIPTVNELFIHTQPAHLQKIQGAPARSGRTQRRPSLVPPRSRLTNGKHDGGRVSRLRSTHASSPIRSGGLGSWMHGE